MGVKKRRPVLVRDKHALFNIALYLSGSAAKMTHIQVHVYFLRLHAVGDELS